MAGLEGSGDAAHSGDCEPSPAASVSSSAAARRPSPSSPTFVIGTCISTEVESSTSLIASSASRSSLHGDSSRPSRNPLSSAAAASSMSSSSSIAHSSARALPLPLVSGLLAAAPPKNLLVRASAPASLPLPLPLNDAPSTSTTLARALAALAGFAGAAEIDAAGAREKYDRREPAAGLPVKAVVRLKGWGLKGCGGVENVSEDRRSQR